jgi:uncharacterized membrane protein
MKNNSPSRFEYIALFIITLVGAFLRFYHLDGFSLSNDELSALNRTNFSSVSQVIEIGVKQLDMHPAGVQVFIYYWIKVFGDSVFSVRFPFALWGTLSIPLLFVLARRWFNTTVGLLSAAALALLQFPIMYSQLARPYSPGLFFSLIAVICWTELVFTKKIQRKSWHHWYLIGFTLATACCMYVHNICFLFMLLVGFTGLFFLNKDNWKHYILCGAGAVILYLPHIPIFNYQFFVIGGLGTWLGKPGNHAIFQHVNYCFNGAEKLSALFLLLFVASIFLFRKQIKLNIFHMLCWSWFLSMFLIVFLYSIWKQPIFQHSILIFSFPYLLMGIFSFIPQQKPNWILVLGISGMCIAIGYSTVFGKKYYSTQHFGVFKELAETSVEWADKYGEQNITRSISLNGPYYINYYFHKLNRNLPFSIYSLLETTDLVRLSKVVDSTTTPYFQHGWSNIYDRPEATFLIREHYPTLVDQRLYFNSAISLYRKPSDRLVPPFYDFTENFDGKLSANDSSHVISFNGLKAYAMTPKVEYGPGIVKKIKKIPLLAGNYLWIKQRMFWNTSIKDVSLCVSLQQGDSVHFFRAQSVQDFHYQPGTWNTVFMAVKLPDNIDPEDELKVFTWNSGKQDFLIDDFSLKLYPAGYVK